MNHLDANPSDLVITSQAFGLLRKALIENLGQQKAKRFLLRFGKDLGNSKAKELLATHSSFDIVKEASRIHSALGHVSYVSAHVPTLITSDDEIPNEPVGGTWFDSFEASLHLDHHGFASECSCYTLSGFASGFMTTIHKKDIFVREITCRATGDEHCTFAVQTKEFWEQQGIDLAIYDEQKIIDELEFTYDNLLAQKNLLAKVTNYHSRLTESVACQNDMRHVLQTAYDILHIPIFISDTNGSILFSVGIDDEILQLLHESKQTRFPKPKATALSQFNQFRVLSTPIYLDHKIFAACSFLYVEDDYAEDDIEENDSLFLERLAVVSSLCFLKDKVSFETTERLKITFLDRLIHHQFQDLSELIMHSKYIDPKIEEDFLTISIKYKWKSMSDSRFDVYNLLMQISKLLRLHQLNGLVSQKSDHIIVFLYCITNFKTIQKKFQQVMNDLSCHYSQLAYKAGISNPFRSLENFDTSIVQAERAMNVPRSDILVYYSSLGFLGTLLENMDPGKLTETAKEELKELLDPDPKMRELLYTLFVYLKNNGKLEKTMHELSLSIGGIKYRIRKTEEILKKDLKDSSTSAYLLLLLDSLLLMNELNFD